MNLLIALMGFTFSLLSNNKRGLLFKQIIQAVPSYKYEKQYSSIISMPVPFNVLAIFIVPVMYLVKDNDIRKKLNMFFLKVIYTPVAVLSILAFVSINILLLPIAYIKALTHKMLIVFRQKKKQDFIEFIYFIFFGFPIMIVGNVVELKTFVVHLYSPNQTETTITSTTTIIPP